MTRASRTSRVPKARQRPAPRRSMTPLIVGVLAIIVVGAAALSFAISSSGTAGPAEPRTDPVAISGAPLPDLTDPSADSALGQPIPSLSGVGLDGRPLEIGATDGPMVIVVLAHWCQHCRVELPLLVDYISQGSVPQGVSIVGLSTAIDPVRPNYPPSAWLEREGWVQPTLIDDAASRALNALGLGSFPGFVFVAADGTVAQRLTGEVDMDLFAQLVEALAP